MFHNSHSTANPPRLVSLNRPQIDIQFNRQHGRMMNCVSFVCLKKALDQKENTCRPEAPAQRCRSRLERNNLAGLCTGRRVRSSTYDSTLNLSQSITKRASPENFEDLRGHELRNVRPQSSHACSLKGPQVTDQYLPLASGEPHLM